MLLLASSLHDWRLESRQVLQIKMQNVKRHTSFNSCVSNQLLHLNTRCGLRKKFGEGGKSLERDTSLEVATTLFELNIHTHGKFFGRCENLVAESFWEGINN